MGGSLTTGTDAGVDETYVACIFSHAVEMHDAMGYRSVDDGNLNGVHATYINDLPTGAVLREPGLSTASKVHELNSLSAHPANPRNLP